MLKDGTYTAWYKTPFDQGTGIVHVADGQIWGQDSLMTYHGACKVDGDRFTATVSTKRHTEGRVTVFGVYDELTLTIEGTCPDKIATYTATAGEAGGVVLQGTLILTERPVAAAERTAEVPAFNPGKLPKLPKLPR